MGHRIGESALPEAVAALHRTIGAHRIALRIPEGGGGALAWSPDGTALLTAWPAGTGDEAAVRSANTGKVTLSLNSATPVTGGAWSADGELIATTHADGDVILWDAASGAELAVLDNGTAAGTPTFDPTGRLLAVDETELQVRIWDLGTGTEAWLVPVSDATGMDFRADGELLAIGRWDARAASVWDMTTGQSVAALPLARGAEDVAFDPTGVRLATLDQEVTMVWDVEDQNAVLSWPSSRWPHALAWSPDGASIARAGHTREVEVFDAETGTKTHSLTGHTQATVRQLAFGEGPAQQLASADDGGATFIWNLEPTLPIAARVLLTGDFRRVSYLEGDAYALVGDRAEDRAVRLELGQLPRIVDQYPETIAEILGAWNTYTNERGSMASVLLSRDGTTAVFDPWTMDVLQTLPLVDTHALSNDERLAAADTVGGTEPAGGEPHVVDIVTGEVVSILADPDQPFDDMQYAAFNPDASLVAVASMNGNFRVHDVTTGEILVRLPISGPESHAQWTSFSADGALIAFGEKAGIVTIVAVEPLLAGSPRSEWLVKEFDALDGTIQGTEFSPDGTLLAVSGIDSVINFFATDDWSLAISLDVGNTVYGTDWNADGSELIASIEGTGIVVITIAAEDLIHLGLQRITRGFTQDECRIYGLDPCPSTAEAVRALYDGALLVSQGQSDVTHADVMFGR